jgi:hypothetical protein
MAEPRVPPAAATLSSRHGVSHRRHRAAGETPRLHQPRRPGRPVANLAAVARAAAVRTRRAQGLPDHITDPAALDEVARLVLAARRRPVGETARPP